MSSSPVQPPDDKGTVSAADLVALRPEHGVPSAPGARVERLRGRPRRAERAPDFSEVEYQAHVNQLCESWVEQDVLVRTLAGGQRDSMATVKIAMLQLAEEAAGLGYEIKEAAARGRDVSMLRGRRIDGLTKLASLVMTTRKLGHQELAEGTVERVRDLFYNVVLETIHEALPPESAERARAALQERMPTPETILRDTGPVDPKSSYPVR